MFVWFSETPAGKQRHGREVGSQQTSTQRSQTSRASRNESKNVSTGPILPFQDLQFAYSGQDVVVANIEQIKNVQ